MKLYHLTSGDRLRGIARFGLTVGEMPTRSIIEPGRIGVWLTACDDPRGQGLDDFLDVRRFRLTVDVDENDKRLARWLEWAREHATSGVIADLREASTYDGIVHDDAWWCYFGAIDPERIEAVHDIHTGAAIENWQELWPASESVPGIPYWRREAWRHRVHKAVKKQIASTYA